MDFGVYSDNGLYHPSVTERLKQKYHHQTETTVYILTEAMQNIKLPKVQYVVLSSFSLCLWATPKHHK